MSFFDAINIAASGLTAESVRMDVSAENLANAETTNGPNGQPYVPQEVVLQQVGGSFSSALAGALGTTTGTTGAAAPGGVEVGAIVNDPDSLSGGL
jgi:flagellar basal-body rod protein FlgC